MYGTLNGVNLEKVLQSVVVDVSRTSYKNGKVLFLKYLFGGRSDLLLFGARSLFESDHLNCLYLIDRIKGTHLRKAMKRYFEK